MVVIITEFIKSSKVSRISRKTKQKWHEITEMLKDFRKSLILQSNSNAHTRTYTHTCACGHAHTHIYIYIYIYIHIYIYIYIYVKKKRSTNDFKFDI